MSIYRNKKNHDVIVLAIQYTGENMTELQKALDIPHISTSPDTKDFLLLPNVNDSNESNLRIGTLVTVGQYVVKDVNGGLVISCDAKSFSDIYELVEETSSV